jgi:hypothetical protein
VAVLGFAALGERIQAGTSRIANARTALVKSAVVYVTFGVENPAHYRLMFGSVLVTTQEGRPKAVADAGLGRERSWRRLSGVELWQASLTLLFGETRILALRFYLLGRPFTA